MYKCTFRDGDTGELLFQNLGEAPKQEAYVHKTAKVPVILYRDKQGNRFLYGYVYGKDKDFVWNECIKYNGGKSDSICGFKDGLSRDNFYFASEQEIMD